MRKHQIDDLEARFSDYAAIAFATAAVEQVVDTAKPHPEVHEFLRKLLDELWRWQREDKIQGQENMSAQEAQALPSVQLYAYLEKLQELFWSYQDQPKVFALFEAAINGLLFILWVMHGIETVLNSGKPFVATADVAEADWSTLAIALECAVDASDDPEKAFDWQRRAIERLAADHPNKPGAEGVGTPVTSEYFRDL